MVSSSSFALLTLTSNITQLLKLLFWKCHFQSFENSSSQIENRPYFQFQRPVFNLRLKVEKYAYFHEIISFLWWILLMLWLGCFFLHRQVKDYHHSNIRMRHKLSYSPLLTFLLPTTLRRRERRGPVLGILQRITSIRFCSHFIARIISRT